MLASYEQLIYWLAYGQAFIPSTLQMTLCGRPLQRLVAEFEKLHLTDAAATQLPQGLQLPF